MPSLSDIFTANLHALRLAAGLSQAQVAHAADISVSYVSMLERGRRDPPFATLQKLADVFKVEPWLFLRRSTADSAAQHAAAARRRR